MHIQLITAHLRAHGVALALLKQDMSPKDKAAAVATFQVIALQLPYDYGPCLTGRALASGRQSGTLSKAR